MKGFSVQLKYYLKVIVVFAFTNISFGQNYKDSLLINLSKASHDSIKIKLLIDAGDNLYYTFPDTAFNYYSKALELSKKNKKQ